MLLIMSCKHDIINNHLGQKDIGRYHIHVVDSMLVDADSISGDGNFYINDSALFFADNVLCTLFQFDINNGKIMGKHFGKGNGMNEVSSMMYAYPIHPGLDGNSYIMGNSLEMYLFNSMTWKMQKPRVMDFSWNDKNDGYDDTSMYNLMFMTDFGMNISKVDDSTLMAPVSLLDRKFKKLSTERYEKGHIFAEIDSKTMKVRKVFGRFPDIYKENPSNLFEFFQYEKSNDTLFVNHSVDSLIYVYKYPDSLLYTIGYEVSGAVKSYKRGLFKDHAHFKEEAMKTSLNAGLAYNDGMLVRTTLLNVSTGETVLQLYVRNDLVGECKMPSRFKYLGRIGDFHYGTSFLPVEKGNRQFLVVYRIKFVQKR